MAWSNGNIRWQLQFASRSNVACRVDIYKRDYTGSTVSQLTGAATPVYWDEDDDDDLLNVYRTKTGYINLIENTYHELDALRPSTDIDHYVEVYYNSTLAFTGFIKAQSFDNAFAPGPRTVKLPITSPLGVAEGLKIAQTTTPLNRTIAAILYYAFTKIPAEINQIIFPTGITINTNVSANLTWRVLSTAFCPYNSEYDNYKEHEQDVFTADNVRYVIESICNCFGLIVHDYPGMLVFSKVDYSGTYGVYDKSTLITISPTPSSTIDSSVVTDYSSSPILSDNGKETNIMPINKLTINYEGDRDTKRSMKFDYAKFWTTLGIAYVTMKNFDPQFSSSYWNTGYIPTDDLVPPPSGEDWKHGMWMCRCGDSLEEKFLWRSYSNTQATTVILSWFLWSMPALGDFNHYTLTMQLEEGTGCNNLVKSQSTLLYVRFRYGSYYWNGSEWTTTSSYVSARSDSSGKISFTLDYSASVFNGSGQMQIDIMAGDMTDINHLFGIKNVEFAGSIDNKIFDLVIPKPIKDKEITVDNGSIEDVSISQGINVSTQNGNQVISPTEGRGAIGMATNYNYMFTSRQKTVIDTLLEITPNIYLQKVKFRTTNPKRKIISCGFTPSEDEMQISMQSINSL